MAQTDVEASRAAARGARAGILPQLSVAATVSNANMPQLGMPVARQAYGGLTLSVPVVNLPGVAHARSLAFSAAATSGDLGSALNDVAFAAVQAYDQSVLARAIADVRGVAVREQEENVHVIELRVQTGKAARYMLVRARAGFANAQQAEEDAAAQRDIALTDLMTLLDLDLRSSVAVPDSFAPLSLNDALSTASQRALRQRPEIRAARARANAAKADLDQAKAAYAPAATLSAQTYNGTSSPQLGSSGSQVALQISLPVVDGGSRSAAVDQARAALEKMQIALERSELSVQRDVADAWRELEAARRNVETARAAIADAEQNLSVAQLRERSGKGVQLEVLDALTVAANAREMLLRSQARLDIAVAMVHHAAGDTL